MGKQIIWKSNKIIIIIIIILFNSCKPKIVEINGYDFKCSKYADKCYVRINEENILKIHNDCFWKIDSIVGTTFKMEGDKILFMELNETVKNKQTEVMFSSKLGKGRQVIFLPKGFRPNPEPMFSVKTIEENTILFENLPFFRILGSNHPKSPEKIIFNISGFRVSFGDESRFISKDIIPQDLLEVIEITKPAYLRIDSVEFVDLEKHKYKRKINSEFKIVYPKEILCANNNIINYADLEKRDTIRLRLDKTKCNFLFFSQLGTEARVTIKSTNHEILYSETVIGISELSSSNYYRFLEIHPAIEIEIVGDSNLKHIIIITWD